MNRLRMSTTKAKIGVALLVAGGLTLTALPASAADLKPMDAQLLQQTVLRQQFGSTLGAWEQYFYNTDVEAAPVVCYSGTGEQMALPKPLNSGEVTYQVGQKADATVTIFQYADQASVDAALKALRATSCPGNAKVPSESGLVAAEQSGDFTNAATNGQEVAMTYLDSGKRVFVQTTTTVVGLAAVQTRVRLFAQKKLTNTQIQSSINKVSTAARPWHKRVLASYKSFGIEGRSR